MSLTRGPATNHTSQRVARQVIRTIEDCGIKKLKHVAGPKNAGSDDASRLPIEYGINDKEIHANINKHDFKVMFPLGINHVQKQQLKDRELKSLKSSSGKDVGTKACNEIKLLTRKEKTRVQVPRIVPLSNWHHENVHHRGEVNMSKTIGSNFNWLRVITNIKN